MTTRAIVDNPCDLTTRTPLLTTKFDYEGAGRAHDQAVAAAPGSTEAWKAYALFHQQQNHFPKARQGYEKALTLARQASDQAWVATTLNDLGVLNFDEHRTAEARKTFEEARAIYREFAVRAPATYQSHVQEVERNLRGLDPVSP